ncbi:alkaline phosphatase [Neisseria sp. N95_16]|uniref:Alkaline phosphatase n=1 Tax=Neisseria brasiliensis TaxID=2666100 RepID=A0A7X2GZ19_9NEIS|nr:MULTISPECIES: C40 family peptidase [Neisseria]MRN38616.1 alkaline phosphatase [Neisseria brasiliensis]PJO10743.1 alkaline phosphatase [Neisseria sp. N95_16]
MILNETVKARILEHASADPEREICGLVIEHSGGLDYFPCRNAADNPAEFFAIDPDDWIAAEEAADVVAVVHSHINGKPYLSTQDRVNQLQTGLPWVLVSDGRIHVFDCRPKLLGRPFVYGQADCCTLSRDALHLCGVDVPDSHRFGLDEDSVRQRIIKHLKLYGFEKVLVESIQAGDVAVFSIGGEANHVGFYLGDSTLLHHLTDRPSRKEHFGGYLKSKLHSVWRHPEFQTANIEAAWNDVEL